MADLCLTFAIPEAALLLQTNALFSLITCSLDKLPGAPGLPSGFKWDYRASFDLDSIAT